MMMCDDDSQLSSMRKQGHCCLSLSQLPSSGPFGDALRWSGVINGCKANRLAPLTPPEFETMMTDGMASGEIKFTVRRPPLEPPTRELVLRWMDRVSRAQNGKDATSICIPQYREAFYRLMSSGGMLNFIRCKWTDAHVKQLAAALQHAHAEGATSQAHALNIGLNELTDAALPILVKMLEAGALPCLKELYLHDNSGISDAAAMEALKTAGKNRRVAVMFE